MPEKLSSLPRKAAAAIRARHDESPAEFWHFFLFWSFWLSLALFPVGYGFREVLPPVCLIFLVLYYRRSWRSSVLARLKPAWLFLCAAAMTVIGVVFSIDPASSALHAGMGINKAYILPFIAMESVRSEKDLRRLVWASVLACFWEGLDGVYQSLTGCDFVMGYPFKGRLTGSLGDYAVGNYLALALVPAFGVWYILRQKLNFTTTAFIFLAIFWPAFYLFQGASSRSAILAIAASLALWAALRYGARHWLTLALPGSAALFFLIFQGNRFAPESVISDNRWDLWSLAWKVFAESPWFGSGAGQYNLAFRSLGLAPARESISISHPHNIYLDMLYAHGVVGFALGMTFLLGFLFWGLKKIRPHIAKKAPENPADLYWILAAWFWLGYAAWLVNGIFGHDFYRIWWLALAMCNMGVMIGAIVNAPEPECSP